MRPCPTAGQARDVHAQDFERSLSDLHQDCFTGWPGARLMGAAPLPPGYLPELPGRAGCELHAVLGAGIPPAWGLHTGPPRSARPPGPGAGGHRLPSPGLLVGTCQLQARGAAASPALAVCCQGPAMDGWEPALNQGRLRGVFMGKKLRSLHVARVWEEAGHSERRVGRIPTGTCPSGPSPAPAAGMESPPTPAPAVPPAWPA